MRLWHQSLIPYLDDKRLLSQHRECCALRGESWGKKHSVVDYVFTHPFSHLFWYHKLVIDELSNRDFDVNIAWGIHTYRGKKLMYNDSGKDFVENDFFELSNKILYKRFDLIPMIYPEHDDNYLAECLDNLLAKHAECVKISIEELRLKVAVEKGV